MINLRINYEFKGFEERDDTWKAFDPRSPFKIRTPLADISTSNNNDRNIKLNNICNKSDIETKKKSMLLSIQLDTQNNNNNNMIISKSESQTFSESVTDSNMDNMMLGGMTDIICSPTSTRCSSPIEELIIPTETFHISQHVHIPHDNNNNDSEKVSSDKIESERVEREGREEEEEESMDVCVVMGVTEAQDSMAIFTNKSNLHDVAKIPPYNYEKEDYVLDTAVPNVYLEDALAMSTSVIKYPSHLPHDDYSNDVFDRKRVKFLREMLIIIILFIMTLFAMVSLTNFNEISSNVRNKKEVVSFRPLIIPLEKELEYTPDQRVEMITGDQENVRIYKCIDRREELGHAQEDVQLMVASDDSGESLAVKLHEMEVTPDTSHALTDVTHQGDVLQYSSEMEAVVLKECDEIKVLKIEPMALEVYVVEEELDIYEDTTALQHVMMNNSTITPIHTIYVTETLHESITMVFRFIIDLPATILHEVIENLRNFDFDFYI